MISDHALLINFEKQNQVLIQLRKFILL